MEQGNVAKKLTGQILENWLLSFADGHGGIQTITKTTTSGLVDTYTITFSDTTTSTFTVTNGRSISNVTTSKSGKVTTVTISYNDGTSSSFTVRDGENVTGITEYWAVSTSGSSQPQSGWQTTPPTMTSTYKYLWHYSQYTYSDNTTTATTPAVQGVYGDKGDTGNTGTSITSVTKTGTSGLVDTYTITFSNGTTTTFQVTNGSEIESIEKTSTAGLVDTYTVTMGSGDTHTFTVTNGRSIVSFTQTSGTHAAGTIDVYTMTYNDGDTSQIQVYNGANGTGAVSTVAGIGVSSAEGDVPLIIKGYGAPTTATVGQVNQLYFDMTGGIMYICISTTGGSYDWRGMSSAVDSAMSTTSANPLQNRVISNKVGVGSLSTDFAATNLTDAANELQTNKANLASPTFTGTPKAPTAAAGTNNTQLATTAFVQNIASDLNGAITNLKRIYATPVWELGTLSGSNGGEETATTQIRSNFIRCKAGTEISCASGYQFNVFMYDIDDAHYIGNSGWILATKYTLATDRNIRLLLRRNDQTTIVYPSNISGKVYIGNYEIEQGYSNDFGEVLPSGTNLDNVTAFGTYWIADGNSYTGVPDSRSYGVLEVKRSDKNSRDTIQVFHYSSNGTNLKFYAIYRRLCIDGVWYPWFRFDGDAIIVCGANLALPSPNSSQQYNVVGMTSSYQLVTWNFSSSAENAPPTDLSCSTYSGYFTITNSGKSTNETFRPLFVNAMSKAMNLNS